MSKVYSPMFRASCDVNLCGVRLSVSQTQGLIAIPQDNRHIHLYDINGVRYGRPTKMSKVVVVRIFCSLNKFCICASQSADLLVSC